MDRSSMMREESGTLGRINVFVSHAPQDEALLEDLKKHLHLLIQSGQIRLLDRRDIASGLEYEREIVTHLTSAQLILLLVSSDFISSHDCRAEMMRAMERHSRGEARVIPIILRPVNWREELFGNLDALPAGAKPVTTWLIADEAFFEVERGIRKVVQELTRLTSGGSILPALASDAINGDTTFGKQGSTFIPPSTLLRPQLPLTISCVSCPYPQLTMALNTITVDQAGQLTNWSFTISNSGRNSCSSLSFYSLQLIDPYGTTYQGKGQAANHFAMGSGQSLQVNAVFELLPSARIQYMLKLEIYVGYCHLSNSGSVNTYTTENFTFA